MEELMKPLKVIIFFSFFIILMNIFGDEILDSIKYFDRSTENFNEATELYNETTKLFNKVNELSAKGKDNLTIGELNKLTDLYTEATEKFKAGDNFQRKANQILADAGLSLDEEETPIAKAKSKPKLKSIVSIADAVKKKARSRAIAMRARAKVQVLIRRMAAEKERIKTFKARGKELGLTFDDNEKGPAFDFVNSFEEKSDYINDDLANELVKFITVFQGFPKYHIDVKVLSSDHHNSKKDMKLSKKRCDNLQAFIHELGISNYDVNIIPLENTEDKNSNIIKVIFYREEGYFRR